MITFLITLGFTMTFMLILYGVTLLKNQKAGRPFNCGAITEICCRDKKNDDKNKDDDIWRTLESM
jgi:hypothetical protein